MCVLRRTGRQDVRPRVKPMPLLRVPEERHQATLQYILRGGTLKRGETQLKKTRPRFGGLEKNALGARFTRWLGTRFSSLRFRGALSDQMFFFFDIPKPACDLHVELPTSAAVAIGRVDSSMAAEIRSFPDVGSW